MAKARAAATHLAHHSAAETDQRRRTETPFFRAEEASDGDVATGTDLAVSLKCDPTCREKSALPSAMHVEAG